MPRPTPRQIQQAHQRRLDAYEKALGLIPDWGDAGMPPLSAIGCSAGILRGLADRGFAEILPRDRLGCTRFRATPAALAPDAFERLRGMFR